MYTGSIPEGIQKCGGELEREIMYTCTFLFGVNSGRHMATCSAYDYESI